jgi:hypothetical protein
VFNAESTSNQHSAEFDPLRSSTSPDFGHSTPAASSVNITRTRAAKLGARDRSLGAMYL